MKLFTRYTRISLLTTIAIFLLAIGAFALLIQNVIVHQLDEDLRIRQKEIITFCQQHSRLPDIIPVGDQLIHYSLTNEQVKRIFRTVKLYDSVEHERNDFRELQFTLELSNQKYLISIAKSMEEPQILFKSILFITVITIFLILLSGLILNRILLKRLWRPFYQILNSVKTFKLNVNEKLDIPSTDITEFRIMSETISKSTDIAIKDYHVLKEFTENASHEMQTPLAVIRSKIDILSQDEQLTEQHSKILQSCYNAIHRLSSLSRSLLLLAKIENRQFEIISKVDLRKKFEQKIEEFKELWQVKKITIHADLSDSTIDMNAELADILLDNLFSNATRYNIINGCIYIVLKPSFIDISNSSDLHELSREKIFQRFYKGETNNHFTGLGLSIIKEICNMYKLTIQYTFSNKIHSFKIFF